ncbi:hypothetical protein B0H66DRAFT_11007 [Apodospora peruviana]|uniref:Uncharacterized protein n=1 Tax=Apodospora peruviana TaxID=516989 RepID=A0AAE0IPZ3_9PEZI|nr:hypothetical protein B0H66DRAFT_11007 [Apodospora peruviana]
MPSVTQETPAMPSSKKRRRDDIDSNDNNGDSIQIPLSHSSLHNHSHISQSLDNGAPLHHGVTDVRKMMPLPAIKRQRRSISNSPTSATQRQIRAPSLPAPETSFDDRPTPQRTASLAPASLMSRCHICSRKPTKKSDLDSFADCQGCGNRTCFICIRECLDWRPELGHEMTGCDREKLELAPSSTVNQLFSMLDADADANAIQEKISFQLQAAERGYISENSHEPHDSEGWAAKGEHRQVICSKCCVETGAGGDVMCLGCSRFS